MDKRRWQRLIRKLLKGVVRPFGFEIVPPQSMSFDRGVDGKVGQISFEGVLHAYLAARPDAFFVQLGSHDGQTGDPLFQVIDNTGIRGLLVEPQLDLFNALVKRHGENRRLIFERAALSNSDGSIELYKADPTFWAANELPGEVVSQIASLDANQIRKHVEQFGGKKLAERESEYLTSETVPALTLSSLLEKHGISSVDILQVDCEGFDYEILQMVDWTRPTPDIVHFEHVHLSESDRLAAWSLLEKHGYRLYLSGGINTLAIAGENQIV